MTIFDKNRGHCKSLSTSIITLVCNVAHNKAISNDDIVSVQNCVDEKLSETESSDSDNEIGDNLIAKVAHQTVNKVAAPIVSGRHLVK
jgi:hypothetical protein